ncbi:MAG: hypothetical protein JRH20_22175 [Deltaproteobacteria bacterium]|nr:hypothetical protein [Deltaproteobacteria bacterium]
MRFLGPLFLSVLLLLAAPAHAQDDTLPEEWFGPQDHDIELSLAGNFGHLFNSKVSSFDVQVGFGYFFTDFLEAGVALQFGYFHVATDETAKTSTLQTVSSTSGRAASSARQQTAPSIGSREFALASGPIIGSGESWYGGTEVFVHFFPFSAFAEDALPNFLGPFVGFEFGALYAKNLSPFIATSLSVGLNIYLTDQIALTPELGYGLVYASDDAVRYDGEEIEHALVANFGLSVFFTP